jgi:hypothetical protein
MAVASPPVDFVDVLPSHLAQQARHSPYDAPTPAQYLWEEVAATPVACPLSVAAAPVAACSGSNFCLHPPFAETHHAQILACLDGHHDLAAASSVSRKWRAVVSEEAVWRGGYARRFPGWGAEATLRGAADWQAREYLRCGSHARLRLLPVSLVCHTPALWRQAAPPTRQGRPGTLAAVRLLTASRLLPHPARLPPHNTNPPSSWCERDRWRLGLERRWRAGAGRRRFAGAGARQGRPGAGQPQHTP